MRCAPLFTTAAAVACATRTRGSSAAGSASAAGAASSLRTARIVGLSGAISGASCTLVPMRRLSAAARLAAILRPSSLRKLRARASAAGAGAVAGLWPPNTRPRAPLLVGVRGSGTHVLSATTRSQSPSAVASAMRQTRRHWSSSRESSTCARAALHTARGRDDHALKSASGALGGTQGACGAQGKRRERLRRVHRTRTRRDAAPRNPATLRAAMHNTCPAEGLCVARARESGAVRSADALRERARQGPRGPSLSTSRALLAHKQRARISRHNNEIR